MVDWRTLGEVPDSEDEDDFDSQISLQLPATDADVASTTTGPVCNDEIWDVPSSLPSQPNHPPPRSNDARDTPRHTAASKAAELEASKELADSTRDKDIWDVPSSDDGALCSPSRTSQPTGEPITRSSTRTRTDPESHRPPHRNSSLSLDSSQELPSIHELATGLVSLGNRAHTSPQGRSAQYSLSAHEATPASHRGLPFGAPPLKSADRTPALLQSQILGHDTDQERAALAAAQPQRSFRTRKLNQMYPFAMEEARFNRSWKASGMRPIKLISANTDNMRHRQAGTDSEEEDFEPESQDSNARPEHSQINGPEDLGSDLVTLMAPSSPMQTSPLGNRGGGGPSSLTSPKTADTDHTSLDDDDELPTIQQLAAGTQQKKGRKKMRPSSDAAAPSKRRRILVPLESSPLRRPPQTRERQDSPDPLSVATQSARLEGQNEVRTELPSPSAHRTVFSERQPKSLTGLIVDDDVRLSEEQPGQAMISVTNDDDSSSQSSESDSGSEVVHKNRSRIRGVLPASWLRMDQLAGRTHLEKKLQRPVHRSPDREKRRGVAQTRRAETNANADALFFSESDDEAPHRIEQQPTTDEMFHNQTRLALEPLSLPNTPAVPIEVHSDDDGSAMEDDHIDRMAGGRKRQLKLSESFAQTVKRPNKSRRTTVPSVHKLANQPKIASALSGLQARPASKSQRSRKPKSKTKRTGRGATLGSVAKGSRRSEIPLLSVLDVIEPGAPQFLRIAARTARSRPEQGRASPTKKAIKLASREDHVEAAQVLNNWKHGIIQQRQAITTARKPTDTGSHLRSTRHSSSATPALSRIQSGSQHAKGPVEHSHRCHKPMRTSLKSLSTRTIPSEPSVRVDSPAFQPAELQTETPSFQKGMRLLDQMYHRGKRATPTNSDVAPQELVRRRQRKTMKPRQVDTSAPQYIRANDPLPPVQTTLPHQGIDAKQAQTDKLRGLAPYGANYSHHFEVFPLKPGIFFHNSTLLGSGVLEKILHTDYRQQLQDSRPNATFTLGQQTMRWGCWNDLVSSEMGIVVDYVCEQLDNPVQSIDLATSASVPAADHLLCYVRSSITFDSANHIRSFLDRSVEVIQRFIDRLTALKCQTPPCVVQVCERLTLFTFSALQICCNDSASGGIRMRLESLLKSLSVATAKLLAPTSVRELRKTYRSLQGARTAERGFRNDDYAIHSWTLLLRILENARVARGSFWDVITEVLLPPDLASNTDVSQQESAWESFFHLLPLTDFTDSGVLIAGGRQRCATDGWLIPKKLLQRVFQIYQRNQQQGASFNSYCRALVARCHCLVQDWGWRRSSGVVGVIFDFFGSQGLRHLRNEEFDRSPNFLQNLPNAPSVRLEPEDRCFHIFLKLLASSIQQLRHHGADKDIRSLVTRTVPNHSRSYAKEQDIHPCDLAALRNHHDLLVTLFWAAPPHRRPQMELLERLVVPASSHKEACLINLRAWNQLTGFIVSGGVGGEHGEAPELFISFNQWRTRFFEQMIQQLDTVATDIREQLLSLSTNISKSISSEMVDAMVSMNKSGILDVIRLSMAASLDVMKHTPNLETASYILSTSQLQRIFNSFQVSPPEMDWDILRIALTTLDSFLTRIDDFISSQESQESESQLLNNALADDALLVLNDHVAGSCFKMARCVLASSAIRDSLSRNVNDRAESAEHVIRLVARLSAKLIGAGVMSLADLVTQGKKYRLFGHPPHELDLSQRKLLTLLVTTLLQHGFDDFSTSIAGLKLEELYILSIVKPSESLAFENRLAEQLIRLEKPYAREPAAGFAIRPDYETNYQLFHFAIVHMHKLLRDAGPSAQRELVSEQTRALQLSMAQMRGDLETIAGDGLEHRTYVVFVQRIISLIKTYGPSSCAVDDFFLQVGNEYWPDKNDPELQVANMAAYGLRVMDGDSRTESQLFWLMFSRFKFAMLGDKLDGEAQLLAGGLREPGIVKFILGSMLPAIIEATARVSTDILLKVYAQSLKLFLDCEDLCFVLGADNLTQVMTTVTSILRFFRAEMTSSATPTPNDLYVLRLLIDILNLLWPSNYLFILQKSSTQGIKPVFEETAQVVAQMKLQLCPTRLQDESEPTWSELLGAVPSKGQACEPRASVLSLADLIVGDVRRTWEISPRRVNVKTHKHTTQSTPSAQGVERPVFDRGELMRDLHVGINEWNMWWRKVSAETEPIVETCGNELLF